MSINLHPHSYCFVLQPVKRICGNAAQIQNFLLKM